MNLNIIEPNRAFLTFGDYDPNFFEGKLNFYPILSTFSIEIDFNWVKFGDGDELIIDKALLDTGNSCISIPSKYK